MNTGIGKSPSFSLHQPYFAYNSRATDTVTADTCTKELWENCLCFTIIHDIKKAGKPKFQVWKAEKDSSKLSYSQGCRIFCTLIYCGLSLELTTECSGRNIHFPCCLQYVIVAYRVKHNYINLIYRNLQESRNHLHYISWISKFSLAVFGLWGLRPTHTRQFIRAFKGPRTTGISKLMVFFGGSIHLAGNPKHFLLPFLFRSVTGGIPASRLGREHHLNHLARVEWGL